MSCSNCFNGCAEIVSDKCVKYTGVSIPSLGIQTGDTLSHIEEVLVSFLQSALDGTGIVPSIDSTIICDLVDQYLPISGDITIVDFTVALIKSACSLQGQVDTINAALSDLNQNYTVDCLSGVTNSSDTHAVVQAVINKLCSLEDTVTALALDLDTNYVKLADLDTLIQEYLDSIAPVAEQQYKKMVPYTAIEYYGPLTNFDAGGIGVPGLGWDKVYLCNGQNDTPDKRGRIPVGVTNVPGGGALNPVVDPVYPGNFNYSLNSTNGTNTVTLTTNQIPSHTHTAAATSTSTVSPNPHDHGWTGQYGTGWPSGSGDRTTAGSPDSYVITTQQKTVSLTVSTNTSVSIGSQGGGQSHTNVPPVWACYYIMYIP